MEEQEQREQHALVGPSSDLKKCMWTKENIKLLLNIRFELNSQFESPKCKKNKLWMQVASQMGEIGKFNITWEECYGKYRNLLQTYRANKEKRLKKTGESSITWEFFDLFDEVLGHKASTYPQDSILSTSIVEESTISKEDEKIRSENDSENEEPPNKKIIKKVKRDKKITVTEYLFQKNEREKEALHNRQILKEREIDAINNLAEAIRESGKNNNNNNKLCSRDIPQKRSCFIL